MNQPDDFDPPATADAPIFRATLTPHRSLSRGGFLTLMAFVAAISFVSGLVFLRMGAWPVFGFFGLDVLIIYGAFRLNFRHARAHEDIVVTPYEIRVRRVSHRGDVMEWSLNPLWARIEKHSHPEFGIERLYLVAGRRRLSIASFLGPDEKASFAAALQEALHAAKRGPTLNPVT
jgi:uncharacterized membrane protein